MPRTSAELARLAQLPAEVLDPNHQIRDDAPDDEGLIKPWEVVLLMLNRSIGSGIFLVPSRVLAGTGCVGGALMLWIAAALISLSGLYVWLLCGFSMPQPDGLALPRSGGELNFVQYMFAIADPRHPHPNLRISCMFGVLFILMYNLTGNAISFAIEVLASLGYYRPSTGDIPDRTAVLLIALLILSLVISSHVFSRRGGIWINNGFALTKVVILLCVIGFGGRYAKGWHGGSGAIARDNYGHGFFDSARPDVSSWASSLLLCLYANSGGEQPFYVLAESKHPRKFFRYCIPIGWLITTVLFLGVNFTYFVVVSKNEILSQSANGLPNNIDMASLFFARVFPNHTEHAERASSALTAFCIAGNLWVMTFTAARVKQEIAKEGVLQPFSLWIAYKYRTPYGILRQVSRAYSGKPLNDNEVDRAPTYAFFVHWLSSGILLAVVAPIRDTRRSYYALASLYSYTMVAVVGCWVCIGLLVIQFRKSTKDWKHGRAFTPWLWPIHPIIYGASTAFVAVVILFVKPKPGSPFEESVTGLPFYLIPVIGISAPFWGLLWYYIVLRNMHPGKTLHITRAPASDDDARGRTRDSVQDSETIDQSWVLNHRSSEHQAETFELNGISRFYRNS